MKALRNYLDKIKPSFEEGGKLAMFRSIFDGFETFLFVPNETSKTGAHIHDCTDSKRAMTVVIIASLPALLFGMYNVGYQHSLTVEADPGSLMAFISGFLAVLPKIIVPYVAGLGVEFTAARVKREGIQEGLSVSGILVPVIVPVNTPLWVIAAATTFAVISAEEVFGGTGYNIFNVVLVIRAFLFFACSATMFSDQVFVRTADTFDIGTGQVADDFFGITPLGQAVITGEEIIGSFQAIDVLDNPISTWDAFIGLIPDSIGKTSILAILTDAVVLLVTGIASWKTVISVFVGGAFMSLIFNMIGTMIAICVSPLDHLFLGGFAFGAVFMATNPVTSARTEAGKYTYDFLISAMVIITHALSPDYPGGMMFVILLMNAFAPLIDCYVVEASISRRLKRAIK